MKKRLLRLAAAVLALTMLVPTAGAINANSQGEVVVRVGLASSASGSKTGELIGANLWNVDDKGAGFRFGYFNDAMDFVELGRTSASETQISVIKSKNTWFKGKDRNSFSNRDNGGSVVGTYNLRLPGTYSTFAQAQKAADRYRDGFVAWINGSYQVRAGSYTTKEKAQAAARSVPGATVVTTSSYGMNVIRNGVPKILFQYDSDREHKLAIMPDVTGAADTQSWFYNLKYRGAFTYERIRGGELTVVNVLSLEDYIKGVVPYEMGRTWPLEALKTQAVCARTYAVRQQGRHGSLGFDICPSAHCQVYYGVGDDRTNWGASPVSDRAVEETAGQVLWYKNRMAETVYSSSHGGASENAKYVWGTDTVNAHPYLRGVVDPYEHHSDSINSRSHWTKTYTSRELTDRLHSKGYGGKYSVDHLAMTYSELGNVIELEVYWSNGEKNSFTPGRIRNVFGLNSIRFAVNGRKPPQAESGKPAEDVYVNGNQKLEDLNGLYVISGSGTAPTTGSGLHVITGGGQVLPIETESGGTGSGRVEVKSSRYEFEGSGWGHQLGMSQFGAHAMAGLGFQYDEICTFYYPGTHVGPIKY